MQSNFKFHNCSKCLKRFSRKETCYAHHSLHSEYENHKCLVCDAPLGDNYRRKMFTKFGITKTLKVTVYRLKDVDIVNYKPVKAEPTVPVKRKRGRPFGTGKSPGTSPCQTASMGKSKPNPGSLKLAKEESTVQLTPKRGRPFGTGKKIGTGTCQTATVAKLNPTVTGQSISKNDKSPRRSSLQSKDKIGLLNALSPDKPGPEIPKKRGPKKKIQDKEITAAKNKSIITIKKEIEKLSKYKKPGFSKPRIVTVRNENGTVIALKTGVCPKIPVRKKKTFQHSPSSVEDKLTNGVEDSEESKLQGPENEVKPYECEICNRRFSIPSSLNIHMKYHVAIKSFGCDICGAFFESPSDLIALVTPDNKSRYVCYQCQYTVTPALISTQG